MRIEGKSSRDRRARGRRIGYFLRRDEDGGTSTIEFVLWLPIFILILSIVVDVCFVFLRQAVMYDVAADTARRYAVGRFGGTGSDPNQATTVTTAQTHAVDKATFSGVTPATMFVAGALMLTMPAIPPPILIPSLRH